jgi:hypothetical protein
LILVSSPPSIVVQREPSALKIPRPRMAWIDGVLEAGPGAHEKQPHGKCTLALHGSWAEIGKQVRRHRLYIVAPPGVKPPRAALLARLADGEDRPVFGHGEFDLKPASAVGDDERRISIAQRQQE